VRADDPRLDVRLDYGPRVRQPLRVVLDPELSCAPQAKIFKDAAALVFAAPDARPQPALEGRTRRVPRAPRGLDLAAVLDALTELETNELLVECGPRLAGALLEADLVDELVLYVAPHFLGAEAAPLAFLRGTGRDRPLPRFEFFEQRLIGDDLRLRLNPRRDSTCSPD
jgi:diaminohydroxyphosphoribosylaminopyrimidine deaminase / 5-amino-6-(5-phosphoribosylamino)uracil reductase